MPISYEYDSSCNLIRAEVVGLISVNDFLRCLRSILRDETIQREFVVVIGCEHVGDPVISFSELAPFRDMWKAFAEKGCAGMLIYTPSDLGYGVFRMIQAAIGSDHLADGVPFCPVRTRQELASSLSGLGVTKLAPSLPA